MATYHHLTALSQWIRINQSLPILLRLPENNFVLTILSNPEMEAHQVEQGVIPQIPVPILAEPHYWI